MSSLTEQVVKRILNLLLQSSMRMQREGKGGVPLLRLPVPLQLPAAGDAAGWKDEDHYSSTTESELWRNAGPSAFHLKGDCVEK